MDICRDSILHNPVLAILNKEDTAHLLDILHLLLGILHLLDILHLLLGIHKDAHLQDIVHMVIMVLHTSQGMGVAAAGMGVAAAAAAGHGARKLSQDGSHHM